MACRAPYDINGLRECLRISQRHGYSRGYFVVSLCQTFEHVSPPSRRQHNISSFLHMTRIQGQSAMWCTTHKHPCFDDDAIHSTSDSSGKTCKFWIHHDETVIIGIRCNPQFAVVNHDRKDNFKYVLHMHLCGLCNYTFPWLDNCFQIRQYSCPMSIHF